MAANINNSAQRFDYARAERDNESNNNGDAATPNGQTPPQSETTLAAPTEQQGQSSGDSSGNHAGTHDPSTPPPPTLEAEAPTPFSPLPTQFRYGLGEVSIGRPDYIRVDANPADRTQPFEGEPSPRETAFAPTLRAANPTLTLPAAAKPIPLPKPQGNISPTSASLPAPTATPSLVTTNAPTNAGQAVIANTLDTAPDPDSPPSNRTPYVTPGLHTAPEQSPHYALAQAYGHEHGYKDDEIMKLAVLMQNNGDQNMGREWLLLQPDVLRAAVNAVVRNPDNSFDTSGVFGGQQGYPAARPAEPRVNIDENGQGYLLDNEGNRTAAPIPTTPPPGWVLEIVPATNNGNSATPEQRYFRLSDERAAELDFPYLPLVMTGHMQVPHGRDSELSIGADGGVHDLSQLKFDPLYGLITPIDNYMPIKPSRDEVGDALGVVLTVAVTAMLTAGVGAAIGIPAITATTTVGEAIVIGAANGAVGGLVSGVVNDNLTFKGVFQSALAGGLFAGVGQLGPVRDLNGLGLDPKDPSIVTSYALRTLSITGQATLRGALQELVGGKFKDGFTQGIAQGLATEIGRAINSDIAARLERGDITAEEATSLRQLSGYTTAAIRALGNPGDPLHAFAQEFIGQLVGDGATVPEVRGTVFDDDGNVMPGIVDTKAPLEDQSRQIYDALVSRGMKPDEAADLAGDYYDRTWLANVQNARPTLTDPVAIQQRMDEIDEALRQQIRAQELNEASLGGGELLEVGGGSGNGARPPAQISTNRGVESALNLAADPFGVLGPIQELRGDFATLDRINVEERINSYRQRLIDLGVPNVPTGYTESIGGPDGRISRDYAGTLDSLERAYTNHLENARYTSQYGDNWKDIRIGRSNMTVQEFEQQVFQRTQASVDDAYARGRQQMSDGSLKIEYNENYTLGRYIDEQTRREMRNFAFAEGISDSQGSQLMAVNRRITGADGRYGIPDLRLGNNLLVDYTLANKDQYTRQIRSWANILPLTGVLIIRPTERGGSYVIPPSAIPKPKPPKG
jgi:hypothetical protein